MNEDELLKKEEARLLKSLSKGGSAASGLTKKNDADKKAKEAAQKAAAEKERAEKEKSDAAAKAAKERNFLEIEKEKEAARKREEEAKRKALASTESTAERLEHGNIDHREGVVSESTLNSVPFEEDLAHKDKVEEERLAKNLGKTVSDVSDKKREEQDRKAKAQAKLEERMKKLGVTDYSSRFD
eukprot:TRINITY_DN15066_c0_g1_i1.p1 TRINITY_DN15066_c0_g1~~TRINITY_DN15066_c0_g1_i1.p1  ORF type:complete len:185 (-),score=96.42 TRINITY_DN15066_c0_g1_i1:212-766(-)